MEENNNIVGIVIEDSGKPEETAAPEEETAEMPVGSAPAETEIQAEDIPAEENAPEEINAEAQTEETMTKASVTGDSLAEEAPEEAPTTESTKAAVPESSAPESPTEEVPPAEVEKDAGEESPDTKKEKAPAESMADYADDISKSFKKLNSGDLVNGTICGISDNEASVDLNYYVEGYIPLAECSADRSFSIHSDMHIGDPVTCLVMREDKRDGRIVLSKRRADNKLAWDDFTEALKSHKRYEVKIASVVKGGVTAFISGIRGFIPASHLALEYVEHLEDWVGKTVEVTVITAEKEARRLVLSAREVAREKAKQIKADRMATLKKGTVMTGKVDKITPYGVFVALEDGLSGLVHISQMADHRIKTPNEVVSEGDEVKVKVLDIKDGKISLTMKGVDGKESGRRDSGSGPNSYKSKGNASTSLGSLLKDIKLNK